MILSSNESKNTQITTSVCVVCALICGGSYIYNNLQSQNKLTVRSQALKIVVQHVLSDTCWKSENKDSNQPFKLGDRISLKGTTYGNAPTGCFFNPGTRQYAQAGYINDQLTVTQVFSSKEIKSQIGVSKQ